MRPITHHSKLLLNRVVSFYHTTFLEDRQAMEYLRSKGITDNATFTDFRIGFVNGTLLNTIPQEGEIPEALKAIGILNRKGHELFYGSVIFPIFDENKDCVDMYGRRITDGETTHLYLPGPRRGIFNHQAAKRSQSLILAESVIDALTLYNAGFRDVIPCYGVNGFTEDHLSLFVRYQTKEVYICFDRDEPGDQGTLKIAGQLKEKGISSYIVRLPVGTDKQKVDINSFFSATADPVAVFEKLLRVANPKCSIRSDKVAVERRYSRTDTGFTIQYDERRYELQNITKEGVKLRVTIKACPGPDPGAVKQPDSSLRTSFHLDTVDLNSHRSRLSFAKACTQLFSEKERTIMEDLGRLIDLVENFEPQDTEEPHKASMSATEEEEALEFLKSPSLFDRILSDFETIGVTGEDANKLMGYIAATSRKLDEPLSILIQS